AAHVRRRLPTGATWRCSRTGSRWTRCRTLSRLGHCGYPGEAVGMGPRVVGAGLGRTGTHSLKLALEQLLGGTCYHMFEVFMHPDDIPVWQRAVDGEMPDWAAFLGGYTAIVD